MACNSQRIGIIGAGKVGNALAVALIKAGYSVNAVSSRTISSAYKLADKLPSAVVFESPKEIATVCDLIFITTPDSAIRDVATSISSRSGLMVSHVAASVSLSVLDGLREDGAITGVFHPLQAISSKNSEILPGITFAIEAEEPLFSLLQQIASRLGGRTVELKENDRVFYHASAIIASNYLVALVNTAAELWQGFGTKEQAIRALMPLIRGTLDNIEQIGIPECLTGPISRGDKETIKAHLMLLQESAPRTLDMYKLLGLNTIPLALYKGSIDQAKATELKELLETNS
ncbi:Rossmann-like and DUF2520 domain-containing protein [Dehalogenimonas etheniformans]|uniref:DUF2520 domain-containing protein n=1 Tax=Dehalogenimonas etheniformans TaxID=1536648 RepID=A0A2P5P971_9CHLR|nr:Rossmann-like and DUF2520 domain-containing protein [Dehalogenimonas etheniformans]PPD58849.1 DUF2520 domain-containing protein [Dehalogenimonas etheniformans]QNT76383.1 DUF2520 domain-containing protein [Dehalogenimonas etheniformans]